MKTLAASLVCRFSKLMVKHINYMLACVNASQNYGCYKKELKQLIQFSPQQTFSRCILSQREGKPCGHTRFHTLPIDVEKQLRF